jgi:hypothetical protein
MNGLITIAKQFNLAFVIPHHFVKGVKSAGTVQAAIGGMGVIQNVPKAIYIFGPRYSGSEVNQGVRGREVQLRTVSGDAALSAGELGTAVPGPVVRDEPARIRWTHRREGRRYLRRGQVRRARKQADRRPGGDRLRPRLLPGTRTPGQGQPESAVGARDQPGGGGAEGGRVVQQADGRAIRPVYEPSSRASSTGSSETRRRCWYRIARDGSRQPSKSPSRRCTRRTIRPSPPSPHPDAEWGLRSRRWWTQGGPKKAVRDRVQRAFPQVESVPPAGIEPATRGLGNRCSLH